MVTKPMPLRPFPRVSRTEAMTYGSAICGTAPMPHRIAGLMAELEANATVIREQRESLAHFKKLFERASEAARIGVWQCDLVTEALTWTDVVYDLFDLPRGIPVDRQTILALYPEATRRELERVRRRAIETGTGFQLDCQIRTARGADRWIRITATVECEGGFPVRIFGMKQDITEERLLAEKLRGLAERDPMTGLANRGRFQSELARFDRADDPLTTGGALMIIDLDGFKTINDTFGHEAGDDLIRHSAERLSDVCGHAELVARIGGDEFAAIFAPIDPAAIEATAGCVVSALSSVRGPAGASARIGASVGVARSAGAPSEEVFRSADAALYTAKAAGRGTYRITAVAA